MNWYIKQKLEVPIDCLQNYENKRKALLEKHKEYLDRLLGIERRKEPDPRTRLEMIRAQIDGNGEEEKWPK